MKVVLVAYWSRYQYLYTHRGRGRGPCCKDLRQGVTLRASAPGRERSSHSPESEKGLQGFRIHFFQVHHVNPTSCLSPPLLCLDTWLLPLQLNSNAKLAR